MKTLNGVPIIEITGFTSVALDISDRILSSDPWNCPIITWNIDKVTNNSIALKTWQ
jgi:hypothetical protein